MQKAKQNIREFTLLSCERCGWEWHPRSKTPPKTCPKCHSPYWETERVRE
jgi:predicted Zn-ribbon and HTH transcriptional regulator